MKDYLKLVGLAVALLCGQFARSADTPEETLAGIVGVMQENYAACTDENMERLLDCMSDEMPNRRRFIQTVQTTWDVEDSYHRLDDVKLLKRSVAPHARTDYPYATAVITQTIMRMGNRPHETSVWRSACENGRCRDDDMAHLMSVSTNSETTRLQMLFKKENGRWKLIAGLTRPEPVSLEDVRAENAESAAEELRDVGVPRRQSARVPANARPAGQRSAFN